MDGSFLDKEKIYREILEQIIATPPKNEKGLAKIKRAACKKYSLDHFPRNSDILECATEKERPIVLPVEDVLYQYGPVLSYTHIELESIPAQFVPSDSQKLLPLIVESLLVATILPI